MDELRFESQKMDLEVLRFVTTEHDYSIHAMGGIRMHVSRAHSFQPAIKDPEDYPTFLWVHALEGYFLLRQYMLNGKAEAWRFVRQVLPEGDEPSTFFHEFKDRLAEFVEAEGLNDPYVVTLGNLGE